MKKVGQVGNLSYLILVRALLGAVRHPESDEKRGGVPALAGRFFPPKGGTPNLFSREREKSELMGDGDGFPLQR